MAELPGAAAGVMAGLLGQLAAVVLSPEGLAAQVALPAAVVLSSVGLAARVALPVEEVRLQLEQALVHWSVLLFVVNVELR